MSSLSTQERYGCRWPADATALEIEMQCIKRGGNWKNKAGAECGAGLLHHYEQMRQLIWPKVDDHRWYKLCRDEIIKNKFTVLMGVGSSGKTFSASWMFLCEWMVFPMDTCVLLASTDIRGLRKRIWGEVTTLWQEAKDKYPWLPGYLLDSQLAITSEELSDNEDEKRVRDLRRGIFGVPCVQNGKYVGLSKFLGIKQKRVRLIGDELSFMGPSFLSSISNLNMNEDFKAAVAGNPNDILDPLGKAAEPVDGWEPHMDPKKTSVWDTKFMNGRCINLVGLDSPNFDFPQDQPPRYKYLPNQKKILEVINSFGADSYEYWSQCVGAMKLGTLARRVIPKDLCRQFGAFENAVWKGSELTKIGFLDAAYGGDRCIIGYLEFGEGLGGLTLAMIRPLVIVPILVTSNEIPEDQIAKYAAEYWSFNGVPPENCFHDSTGRGSLGTSFARIWSNLVNPVDFGGSPTSRPVRNGLFVEDERTGGRRLKRCDEHYSKFVTELWYSVRYSVESGQLRGLSDEASDEGAMRKWERVRGDKIEVETKEKMKERVGRSPDLMDGISIGIEGARQRGFQINQLGSPEKSKEELQSWLAKERQQLETALQENLLQHV